MTHTSHKTAAARRSRLSRSAPPPVPRAVHAYLAAVVLVPWFQLPRSSSPFKKYEKPMGTNEDGLETKSTALSTFGVRLYHAHGREISVGSQSPW